MKFTRTDLTLVAVQARLAAWCQRHLPRVRARVPEEEPPLRTGLFSVVQLAQHATVLADLHPVTLQHGANTLIPRLSENEQVLLRTYDLLSEAVAKGHQITPAAEWLLDNFYVLEEQILTARKHFPRAYGQILPRLSEGPSKGLPRVYVMALDLVSHVDGGVDSVNLDAFIAAYQKVASLSLGELWAIPIMLRLALIENLRRVATRLEAVLRDRDAATAWAGKLLAVLEQNPSNLVIVLADLARANPPFTSAFAAELMRHLHGQSPHFALAQSWLEQRSAEQGSSIAQLVQLESQSQAADQISVGNSISSLRRLSSMDWRDFVEGQSAVERILRRDPAGVYAEMSFSTRNRYRSVVELLARESRQTECFVADEALRMAAEAYRGGRESHIGYYLLDVGRERLASDVTRRRTLAAALRGFAKHRALLLYLSAIGLVGAGITLVVLHSALAAGATVGLLALLLVPVALCSVHVASSLVNLASTRLVPPRAVPHMDFRNGIPPEHRTMVVVPSMLGNAEAVRNLLERIELHYMASQDPHLHFALITDFKDAAEEHLPSDVEQIRQLQAGITALADRYAHERRDIFYAFHRPRQWNACDRVWRGRERKRGKLEDFNAILRGGARDCFDFCMGDLSVLPKIRYVITLDTDTQLPRDAARDLVGAMAHVLNRPVLDASGRRVIAGHGILQPRVAVSLPTARQSWFVRLSVADAGLDPYTTMVSDVYQDLFDEGSFIGKGIYDVDAIRATCSAFPENAILSHDLLEGLYARSALFTDVELFEDYPARYASDALRRYRWIRGDWQIAAWILPRVPGPDGAPSVNPVSMLSRWKVLDNLRRSLVGPSMMLLLLFAWLFPWAMLPVSMTFFVLFVIGGAQLFSAISELHEIPPGMPWRLYLRGLLPANVRRAAQTLIALSFLPYESCLALDAICRTLCRTLWTHTKMLEWVASVDAERGSPDTFAGYFRFMRVGPLFAVAAGAVILLVQPAAFWVSMPLLALWLLSPVAGWFISRPIPPTTQALTGPQTLFLRGVARKTWRYFEDFVGEEDHWLPPDNFQETPDPKLATRTSPTNLGMALLANLAAYDFGYLTPAGLMHRTRQTLMSMATLARHRGHFYNWYDTRKLEPLQPLYVSTVDSGNLAMHLRVLKCGLLEIRDAPVIPAQYFAGLQDTLRIVVEAEGAAEGAGPRTGDAPSQALCLAVSLLTLLEHPPTRLRDLSSFFKTLEASADELARYISPNEGSQWWVNAFRCAVNGVSDELRVLVPWAHWSPKMAGGPDSAPLFSVLFEAVPSLRALAALEAVSLAEIEAVLAGDHAWEGVDHEAQVEFSAELWKSVVHGAQNARARLDQLEQIVQDCEAYDAVDFTFLYDQHRDLFCIGYNVGENRLDNGFYDLLASESRAASYFAIAQGQVGQEHWFSLRRMLTMSNGRSAFLSWNGSMFEYLMPLLVMPTYENTLLDQTYRAVVHRQIEHARRQGVPWGISESGYNARDLQYNYQYRGFGVPGLGLKRGLVEDCVVAPYASMLALMVAPATACKNLECLATEGQVGAYGFYEAIDYTPSRLPRGSVHVTVRSFMVHHQGMGLLAMAYAMLDRPMQRRFDSDPALRATGLLLQERIPRLVPPIYPHAIEVSGVRVSASGAEEPMRVIKDPSLGAPEIHLLSNGRLHVMVSSGGGGYSRWGEIALTRWHEDPTRDCWGSFCYLRDIDSGTFWSVGHQPTLKPSEFYEAVFVQAKAEFKRRDEGIELHTEISVSPEDDIELRRTTITNRSGWVRRIEVTSYSEVVLAPIGQDLTHPAFSNLFVQTEILRQHDAVLCTRRPRSPEERPPWLSHLLSIRGKKREEASFECNRFNFIGRGRSAASPLALVTPGPLSGTDGCVLDPIVAIRRMISLQPDESVRVEVVTGISEDRTTAEDLIEKYHDPRMCDRVFELALTHSQVELRHINASEADAQRFLSLAGAAIYTNAARRAPANVLKRNRRAQSGLWSHGISGDIPIMLIRIREREKLELLRHTFQAHAYWRLKGLVVDLVVWTEDESVYRQDLYETIVELIAASPEAAYVDKPGGVFLLRGEQLQEEDRILLQASARVVLSDDAGNMREQIETRLRRPSLVPQFRASSHFPATAARRVVSPSVDLTFFNGLGGFTHDGREYITVLGAGNIPPAPWCNIIANPHFGTVVSESGSVYTWAENSHEFRLTPWNNDPVSDVSGEAVYLRDEETGHTWCATPQVLRGGNPYTTRHGFGYSVFEHEEEGIASELTLYVDTELPVKFVRLKMSNRSGRPRRLSGTAFWELVLGELRYKTIMHIVTEIDDVTGAVFARNPFSTEFGGRLAFFHTSEIEHTLTGDREEFLGRNGSTANPAAMHRARLSGRVGAGLDPGVAIQAPVLVEDGGFREIIFVLGSAQSEEEAHDLIQRTRGVQRAQVALQGVWDYWGRTLGRVHVETPDIALNYLANGWLIYQTLSCRLWARTGFYQSGGAFGFRDQLQDTLALVHAEPALMRAHLLRAAARQFIEGDVQHWWHAHSGRGVRTHFSDDYLWLPYVVCHYVEATGDTGVLDELVPFLDARPVRPEEEGYYDLPQTARESASLYEHCRRAVRHGLRFGAHGLPLMGCGDWNDGMNLVGREGKGESVWLAFFLYDVLQRFAPLARANSDGDFAGLCTSEAEKLAPCIETHGWDGEWYRRAYFDDGQPLGSAENTACQIDAIAQSWAVLSGAAMEDRAQRSMNCVDQRLVRREAGIIQLFDPPFDNSDLEPGYIKGYAPGVRENGGQYTHAAIWSAMAFAKMGDTTRAWEMFALLSPIAHASTPEGTARYRVEPYVIAADIYGTAPHTGRGGWTWYTGSAAWMYRFILESLLGLHRKGDALYFTPCLPRDWKAITVHYRYRETHYHIRVINGGSGKTVKRVQLDGVDQPESLLHMVDNQQEHAVEVHLE